MIEARFAVRLTPRGGRDAIEGWSTDAAGRAVLRARVAAAASDGAANDSLVRLLARSLDLAPSQVRIVSGFTARSKLISVAGVSLQTARARLEPSSPG